MGISFELGWDRESHHTSSRSQEEVEAIIEEIPKLDLGYDFSKGSVKVAITMGFPITVKKGIHDDSRGKHITIEVLGRTWHLYLKQDEYRFDRTFLWRVDEIR